MSTVLPIDKEMNDSSALWGDIQRFQMKEAKPVIPVIETPQSAAESSVFSDADMQVLFESLKMYNINDKYKILRIVYSSLLGNEVHAISVPIEPLPAAPAPSAPPAPSATFAEVVGYRCAVAAAVPVPSATVKPEIRMCPYGARCKIREGKCRNGGHPKKKPVSIDGKFFDKDDTRCRHDGGGKCCVYIGCVFAHETDADGNRIHIKK